MGNFLSKMLVTHFPLKTAVISKVSVLQMVHVWTLLTKCSKQWPRVRGRNDHVTMFILHLPLAVFSFSVKLRSFAFVSNARIVLFYYHLCATFSRKPNANLTFTFRRKRDYQSL